MDSNVTKLYTLALNVITDNFDQCILSKNRDDFILPAYVCDDLLYNYASCETKHDFFNLFKDTARTKLEHVRLQSSNITDESFSIIIQHKPKSLKLDECSFLTGKSLEEIRRNCANLTTLNIGLRVPIFSPEQSNLKFDAPNLKILELYDCPPLLDGFVSPGNGIVHLNLTGKKGGTMPLHLLGNLVSLVLHNAESEISNFMRCEFQMRYLCHLDISNSNLSCSPCPKSVAVLTRVVEFLPALQYLDISGTNMIVHEPGPKGCTLSALKSRIGNPLDFLGICSRHICLLCRHNPFTHSFPAKSVASFNNIDQVLMAAEKISFLRIIHATVIAEILRYLEQYFEDNMGMMEMAILDKVLPTFFDAMSDRKKDLDFQQLCFSALIVIEQMIEIALLSEEEDTFDEKLRRRMIELIIEGMDEHIEDCYIIRTGSQLLPIVRAMVIESYHYYDRLIILLVRIIANSVDDHVLRGCIPIFISLTNKLDEQTMEKFAQSKVIKLLLGHILPYVSKGTYHGIILFCWVALSKLTNGMPRICEMFIEQNGIDCFTRCIEKYSSVSELLIPLTCVISNLSKMSLLRPILKTRSLLEILRNVLNTENNNEPFTTAKYNAMEAVIYLASDGLQDWSVEEPSMNDMLLTLTSTLLCLDFKIPHTIKYKSLSYIIQMLKCADVPQCQLWAVWVILQLLNIDIQSYGLLLVEENGLAVIDDMMSNLNNVNSKSVLVYCEIVKLVRQIWCRTRCIGTSDIEDVTLEP